MSYHNLLLQMQACLGSASIFPDGTAHISIGDEKIYTYGKTPVVVLELNPGLVHIRESFDGGHLHEWHMPVTVGASWTDAADGPEAINNAYQAVIDQVCKYPHLGLGAGGTIREAHLMSARLEPINEVYGSVKFANVQLTVAVTEDVTVQEEE